MTRRRRAAWLVLGMVAAAAVPIQALGNCCGAPHHPFLRPRSLTTTTLPTFAFSPMNMNHGNPNYE